MAITKITNPELFNLGDSTSATQLPVMTTTQRIAMNAAPTFNIDYLVVAGGGGGGMGYYGGGGGAGGLLTNVGGTSLVLATGGSGYIVTVGDGGSGAASKTVNGTNGSNSIFNAIEAYGGGGAASRDATGGSSGGSGGGVANPNAVGGSGTVGQGNDGGTITGQRYGSGGGGANQAGQIPPQTYYQTPQNYSIGAPGGNGLEVNITGVDTFYAGGGGGGARATYSPNGINGGLGGGGAGGAVLPGSNGIDELGGGGGGGGFDNDSGGSGGSGIVILRYPTADIASYTATGLTPTEDTTTISGQTILSFTTVGTGTISFTSSTPTGTISTGEMIFNSDTDKVEYWDGTKWYGITYEAPQIPIPATLISFLNANNPSSYDGSQGSTWTDLTTNVNNGTLVNTPTWTSTGYFNFNGSNQYVDMGTLSNINFSSNWSYSLWFNINAWGSLIPTLLGAFDGTYLYTALDASGTRLRTTYYTSGLNQYDLYSSNLSLNTWYNVTVTISNITGLTVYVYDNTNLLQTLSAAGATGSPYTSSGKTLWGAYQSTASRTYYFNGQIAQARIYNDDLSASDAAVIHAQGKGF